MHASSEMVTSCMLSLEAMGHDADANDMKNSKHAHKTEEHA